LASSTPRGASPKPADKEQTHDRRTPARQGRAHHGIGLGDRQASAIAFAQEGADIVVHYLHDAEGADKTRRAVEDAGRRAIVAQADFTDEHQVGTLFDQAVATFGRVDVLMNNAGVDASGTEVAELETAVFDRAIRANLYGAFFCCRRYIQLRKASGAMGGKIINVTSVHQEIPNAGGADYDCSKGGAAKPHAHPRARTCAAAHQREQPGTGHGPHALQPTGHRRPGTARRASAEHPVQARRKAGRDRAPRLFLASSDSDYVTGSTYFMDGGLMRNLGQGA
jgi:glucose 1-dehydrogenase